MFRSDRPELIKCIVLGQNEAGRMRQVPLPVPVTQAYVDALARATAALVRHTQAPDLRDPHDFRRTGPRA